MTYHLPARVEVRTGNNGAEIESFVVTKIREPVPAGSFRCKRCDRTERRMGDGMQVCPWCCQVQG